MLDDPSSHDDVVDVLGAPEIDDVTGGKNGSEGSGRADESDGTTEETPDDRYAARLVDKAIKADEEAQDEEKEAEEQEEEAENEAELEGVENTSSSTRVDGDDHAQKTGETPKRRARVRHPDSETDDYGEDSPNRHKSSGDTPPGRYTRSGSNAFQKRSETIGSRVSRANSVYDNTPAMGPQLVHTNEHGEEEADVELTGDPLIDSHRLELYLLKELVDRVTRLEAQSRQMLIDTMDKDVARTLLLADRNCEHKRTRLC